MLEKLWFLHLHTNMSGAAIAKHLQVSSALVQQILNSGEGRPAV